MQLTNDSVEITSIGRMSGSSIEVKYNIPWECDPKGGGYHLAVFKILNDKATEIPNTLSYYKQNIVSGKLSGTVYLEHEYPNSPYIVAFGLCPNTSTSANVVNNYCASASIKSLASEEHTYDCISLNLDKQESDSVVVLYHTLEGTEPNTQGHWAGIWKKGDDIDAAHVIQFKKLPYDLSEDEIIFSDLDLIVGREYQVCYFTGGYHETQAELACTQMAARVKFKVSAE